MEMEENEAKNYLVGLLNFPAVLAHKRIWIQFKEEADGIH